MPKILELVETIKQSRSDKDKKEHQEYLDSQRLKKDQLQKAVKIVRRALADINGEKGFQVRAGGIGDNFDYVGHVLTLLRCGETVAIVNLSRRMTQGIQDEQGTIEPQPYYVISFETPRDGQTFNVEYHFENDDAKVDEVKYALANYLTKIL